MPSNAMRVGLWDSVGVINIPTRSKGQSLGDTFIGHLYFKPSYDERKLPCVQHPYNKIRSVYDDNFSMNESSASRQGRALVA